MKITELHPGSVNLYKYTYHTRSINTSHNLKKKDHALWFGTFSYFYYSFKRYTSTYGLLQGSCFIYSNF